MKMLGRCCGDIAHKADRALRTFGVLSRTAKRPIGGVEFFVRFARVGSDRGGNRARQYNAMRHASITARTNLHRAPRRPPIAVTVYVQPLDDRTLFV
jgi:hypothetical protein